LVLLNFIQIFSEGGNIVKKLMLASPDRLYHYVLHFRHATETNPCVLVLLCVDKVVRTELSLVDSFVLLPSTVNLLKCISKPKFAAGVLFVCLSGLSQLAQSGGSFRGHPQMLYFLGR
jgi:hypothetical protein